MTNDIMVRETAKLLSWLRAWDEQTYQHSLRTAGYAFQIASQMHMAWQDRRDLLVAATLHDIGKRTIPQRVLRKSGKLTDEEYGLIREHAEAGSRILPAHGFPERICDAVRDHHEQPDGNGYRGCTQPARYADIIRVADCLDVMFSGRSYQKPKTREQVEEDLKKNAGKSMAKPAVDAALRAYFISAARA